MNIPFEKSVFINCPFDSDYVPLLRPLLFTVLYFKLTPRLSLENANSGEARLGTIVQLIKESKFSIHDLSRCCAKKKGELFRLNMPLELGLDIGCRKFMRRRWSEKTCLILETERYRFQKTISDMSGSDICAHRDDPEEIVRVTRDWLIQEAGVLPASASKVWGAFQDFMAANYDRLLNEGYNSMEIDKLPVMELHTHMAGWIAANV
jgi:hypothetical protein